MQSLKEHGETKAAEIQNAEVSGGCSLPGDTTHPNATYPLGATGNQIEQLSSLSQRTDFVVWSCLTKPSKSAISPQGKGQTSLNDSGLLTLTKLVLTANTPFAGGLSLSLKG